MNNNTCHPLTLSLATLLNLTDNYFKQFRLLSHFLSDRQKLFFSFNKASKVSLNYVNLSWILSFKLKVNILFHFHML